MGQKGGALAGIIIVSLLIIPLLVALNFGYLGSLTNRFTPAGGQENASSPGPASLLNQTSQTKIQADLKAISTAIEAYTAEWGSYPDSLQEVDEYLAGMNTTSVIYEKCSDYSAILYHNSENHPGFILGSTGLQPTSGATPSC